MFIRESQTINRKTGAVYITHRLVESYRTENGPRQRVVMNLGTLTLPKSEWRRLAAELEARLAGQSSFFASDPRILKAADAAMANFDFHQLRTQERQERREQGEWLSIDLQSITTSQSRSLGPELVGHTMWERLGLPELLASLGWSEKQATLAEAVVIGRLVAPSSDLAAWSWLRQRTSLPELLTVDVSTVGKDAVYEAADRLLAQKTEIEAALRQRETLLFPRESRLFLYDLTNMYFEGAAAGNTLAAYGRSKEKRSDCPLVTLALLVDEFGFPVLSQIFRGNQSEPETLPTVIGKLKQGTKTLFEQSPPTFIMDRGIATKDNLDWLKEKNYQYIVVERRDAEKQFLAEFEAARETFERLGQSDIAQPTVYVKKIMVEDRAQVLCLSEGRSAKETAIDGRREQRLLSDLERLRTSVRKGNIVLPSKVGERIGRLQERYPSIAQHYDVRLEQDEAQRRTLNVVWEKRPSREERAVITGCYVIEASRDHAELEAAEIWSLYMTLVRVEDAFRALKTDLGARPIYHHTAGRTEAHLFVSVMAYHLLATIERQLREAGNKKLWSTVRTELSTHQRVSVTLTDDQARTHYLRVSGTPEPTHRDIYRQLGVKDPLKRAHRLVG